MARRSEDELKPRNRHTLRALLVSRISGCSSQKEASLDDQEDNGEETVRDLWDGPVEIRRISTKGKGERLDRPEIQQIEAAYRSGEYDVVVFDDLSRLIRGGEAARLLGVGVDRGTRTICIEDGIDTNDGTWEEDALNACSENVAHNERTSKRIKRKNMNRFKKYGWPTGRPISGYIVPEDAKSYDDWKRDTQWKPLILEGAELLRKTLDISVVADFFNESGFPVGPYVRREDWIGYLVRGFYGNSLLKGKPQRGARHTVKHHGTGRRLSVKNPKGPTYYDAPHLAFLSEDEFDSLNALLDAANEGCGRKKKDGVDPLSGISRSDSRFLAMHARCWYCGFHYVWGANGIKEKLMCNNARGWHCWNSIGFPGVEAVKKISNTICEQLSQLDKFDDQFAAMVESAGGELETQVTEQWRQLRRDEARHERDRENVTESIRQVGPHEMLQAELDALAKEKSELLLRRHRLENHRSDRLQLPESARVLRQMLEEEFGRLAIDSPEFGRLLRQLVPEFYLYTVRLCDGGHLYPRAKVTLNLAGQFPDANLVPGLEQVLSSHVTLDLFEPPQRERIRKEVVELTESKKYKNQAAIAQAVAERPTKTAVQRALALHRTMHSLGLEDPYVQVLDPPDDYNRLRRHRHTRYCFQPRDGYARPVI